MAVDPGSCEKAGYNKEDKEEGRLTIRAEIGEEDSVFGPGDLALSLRDGVQPPGIAQRGGRDDEVSDQPANLEVVGLQRNPR